MLIRFKTQRLSTYSHLLMAFLGSVACLAQTAPTRTSPKPVPDVLVFENGDRLTGQFERSNGASVAFKADMAGEITVDWTKVKELHTSRQFAVIPKNVEVKKGE